MKTFTKIAAALLLCTASILPAVFAPSANAAPPKMAMSAKMGKMKMAGKKGGYVHATTYMSKTGKMVHRKGYYRHSTKMTKMSAKMSGKMSGMKMAPKKAM